MESNKKEKLSTKIHVKNFVVGIVAIADLAVTKAKTILNTLELSDKNQTRLKKVIASSEIIQNNYKNSSNQLNGNKIIKKFFKQAAQHSDWILNKNAQIFCIEDETKVQHVLISDLNIKHIYKFFNDTEKNTLWNCVWLMYVSSYISMYVANFDQCDQKEKDQFDSGMELVNKLAGSLSSGIIIQDKTYYPYGNGNGDSNNLQTSELHKQDIAQNNCELDKKEVNNQYTIDDLFGQEADENQEPSSMEMMKKITSMVKNIDFSKIDLTNNPNGLNEVVDQLGLDKYLSSDAINNSLDEVNQKLKEISEDKYEELINGCVNMINPNDIGGTNKIYKNMIGGITKHLKGGIDIKNLSGFCEKIGKELSEQKISEQDIKKINASKPQFMENMKNMFQPGNGNFTELAGNILNTLGGVFPNKK